MLTHVEKTLCKVHVSVLKTLCKVQVSVLKNVM